MKGIFFLLVGFLLLGLCLWRVSVVRDFVRTAASAEGTVISLNAGSAHPQIRFTASSGELIEYPQGGLIYGYRPGDKIRVVYDPLDPRGTASIDRLGALWFAPIVFLMGSIVFLCCGWMAIRGA